MRTVVSTGHVFTPNEALRRSISKDYLIPKRAVTFLEARKHFDDGPLPSTRQPDCHYEYITQEIKTIDFILEKMKKDFEDIRTNTAKLRQDLVGLRHEKLTSQSVIE